MSPVEQWANVIDFGADPTGMKDSSAAIQRAIDSGATTVFVPGFLKLEKTVELRGNVNRFIGTGGHIDYDEKASPDIRIVDGASSVIQIEHLSSINGGVEVDTSRTVVFKSLGMQILVFSQRARGGKLFLRGCDDE